MYAPTKPWRTWHRKVNLRIKRYAVICAIASSGVAALVSARGNRIEKVTEVPVVVDDAISSITKTSTALASLKAVGAGPEMRRGVAWRTIRRGVGKTRNRRYVTVPRILIVYSSNNGVSKAFQNIPGVESISVESLNLLKLAPGGHVGRFLIWTKSAVERIDNIFLNPMKIRKNYISAENSCMTNTDLSRIINGDDIQASLNKPKNDSRIMKKKVSMSRGMRATSTPVRKRFGKMLSRKKVPSEKDLEIHGSRQRGTTSTRAIQKQFPSNDDYKDKRYKSFLDWLGLQKPN
jgi:large subunit ribosomal protein L4e